MAAARVGQGRRNSSCERRQRQHCPRCQRGDDVPVMTNFTRCGHWGIDSCDLNERGDLSATAAMRSHLPRHLVRDQQLPRRLCLEDRSTT